MRSASAIVVVLLAAFGTPSRAAAADPATTTTASKAPERWALGRSGTLVLDVPAGWRVLRGDAGTLALVPSEGAGFSAVITEIPSAVIQSGPDGDELLATLFEATERSAPLLWNGDLVAGRAFAGAQGRALRGSVPIAPTSSGFTHDVFGVVEMGHRAAAYVAWARSADAPELAAMTSVMARARLEPAPREPSADRAVLSVPGRAATLVMSLPGFEIQKPGRAPVGVAAVLGARDVEHELYVNAWLEPAGRDAEPASCRNRFHALEAATRPKGARVERTERPGMALVTSFVEKLGSEHDIEVVHAYLGRAGLCADVHVSKTGYAESDRPLFEKILAGLRIEDIGTPHPPRP